MSNGAYRTPLPPNRIPEPEVSTVQSSGPLAAAHWDGRLNCRLAIDIGASPGSRKVVDIVKVKRKKQMPNGSGYAYGLCGVCHIDTMESMFEWQVVRFDHV